MSKKWMANWKSGIKYFNNVKCKLLMKNGIRMKKWMNEKDSFIVIRNLKYAKYCLKIIIDISQAV